MTGVPAAPVAPTEAFVLALNTPGIPATFEAIFATQAIRFDEVERPSDPPSDPPSRVLGTATVLNMACRVEVLFNHDGQFVALCARPLDTQAGWPLLTSFPDMDDSPAPDSGLASEAPDPTDSSSASLATGLFLQDCALHAPLLLYTAAAKTDPQPDLNPLSLWAEWPGAKWVDLLHHDGFSLFGDLGLTAELGGPLAALRQLLGAGGTLVGAPAQASINNNQALPYLQVRQPIVGQARMGPLSLADAALTLAAPLYPSKEPARVLLSGTVTCCDQHLALTADIPMGPGELLVTGWLTADAAAPIDGLAAAGLPTLQTGELLEVELRINAEFCRLDRLTVFVERNHWDLLDGLLTLQHASFAIWIDDPLGSKLIGGEACATVQIEQVLLDIGGIYPGGPITGDIRPAAGQVLSLQSLAKALQVEPSVLPDLNIETLRVRYGLGGEGWAFSASVVGAWPTPPAGDFLHLETVNFSLQGPSPATVHADLQLRLGDSLWLCASATHHGSEGWVLVGATRQGDRVEVGQLLAALEQHYHQGVDLPRAISTLAFEDLALFYSQADSRLTLACTLTLRVAGADVRLDLNTVVQGGTAGHSVSITGALTVAGHAFNFSGASSTEGAEKSGKPKQQLALVATYVHRPDENTPAPDIHELVLALAPAAAEVVPHIKLTDALIAYLSEGDADHSTARWLLGACFDAELDLHAALNGVPIVSALLGDRLNLSVSALQLLVASKPFSESDIDALGQPAGFSFPATLGHALITGQLGVGSDHHPLTLNMGEQPAVPAPPPSADAADAADAADEASGTEPETQTPTHPPTHTQHAPTAPDRLGDTSDSAATTTATASSVVAPATPTSASPGAADTQWIAIAQHFGPLYLEQVGVAYRNSRVSIALGLSITAAEMSLSLQGLRIETPLNAFKPSFDLAGLGLTYSASTLEVSGGLLKTGTGVATRYDGEALIKASGFTIAALGSYASTPQGDASLFIYGLLNKELGGPTLFHVTGLAAGFGYNRRLTLPTLDTVGSFPLVSMAKADTAGTAGAAAAPPDLTAVLAQLGSVLEVASGEHWLALGLRFTSYEVIDTFALLVVSFGTQVEIDLIGESTLSMPAKLDAGQQPIAYARLAERATFIPDRGIFTAAAKLSDDAYILSRDCHLSGGFAVSSWFKDALAGDFVVTLGGYHPSYAKPAHYPDVVPVGFTWQLGDLDIKGGLYFALTPTMVMAGGHLDAVWQSGALRAWFLVHADFLMSWKPFHYEAEVGVGIGASFRVDLWITSFTMTVRVDVELQLWGPSFGGTARVDLSVISFSVDFGAPRPAKAWISWSAFKQSFLPPWVDVTTATPTRAPALTAAPLMPPSYATELDDDGLIRPPPKLGSAYCMARAAAGLDRDLGAVWVVNGSEFELVTHSLIPAQSARMFFHGDIASVSLLPGADPKARPNVEVGPMNLQDAEFISEHFVVFSRLDDQTQLPVPTPDFLRHVNVEPRWAKVPPAIWAVGASSTDTQLKTALIGFRFWAKLVSTRSKSVDVKTLEVQDQEPMPARFWSAPERLELPEAAGLMADYGQVLADHADHADNADSAPGEPALRDAVCSLMVSTLRAHQDLRTALLDELGQHLVLQADERTQTLPLDMGLVMRCEPRFAPLGELI